MTLVAANPQPTELDGYITAPSVPKFVLGVGACRSAFASGRALLRASSLPFNHNTFNRHFRGH